MAKVKWLPEAIADVERLYSFLKDKDIEAATRAADCILQGSRLLATSPRLGRPMPDDTGRRELFVAFGAGAYVLRYMLETEGIPVVIRVWHSKEYRK
ncbi:type II toxin-antitoxin system RelE/ParE family toxin [Candidatus Saccharibacteria bacterium]|nr:type II toxin-antitoxin system RelE/ParE family toxin [Candidatus Saccharibacteria bacterium]